MDSANITDNKQFWKAIKPFFCDNVIKHDRITFVKDDKITSNKKLVAETLQHIFVNVAFGILNQLKTFF